MNLSHMDPRLFWMNTDYKKKIKLHIPLSEGSELCSYDEQQEKPVASDALWALVEYCCSQMEILCCLVACLDMTYYPQWQAFMEIIFPWYSHLLTSIIKNLLLVLKTKQVLIQILTQGLHIMSKSLTLLCCYWKWENWSLLHFLFQTATTGLSYFIWNQYREPKSNKPEILWQF